MSPWYSEFNAVFFTGIATMIIGIAGLAIKYGFASKCDNVEICYGLLKIHRQVEFESPNIEISNNTEDSSKTKNLELDKQFYCLSTEGNETKGECDKMV